MNEMEGTILPNQRFPFHMSPEDRIVLALAQATCKRIAHRVRTKLQQMTDGRLSGDDSPLANTWDELCVELQQGQSLAWSVYEETLNVIVAGCVELLPRNEAEAIWLQTDDADEKNSLAERPAIYPPALVKHIIQQYVIPMASDWSNRRIRDYLDRHSS